MNFDEIPKMKEAYEKLYIVENLLRYYIKEHFAKLDFLDKSIKNKALDK
ncbi:hypothetical protein [Ureibacillus thermosphaericus]